MTNEIITHKFRELLLPTILIAMALNMTAIIDSSFVATFIGHYGQAALQVLEPLIMLITIFEWLFGLGGQILSLNKKAEFDEQGSNHYFTIAMLTTILASIMIFIVCFLFKDTIISLLNPPSDAVVPYVEAYGNYLFVSFPMVTILSVLSQFIRVDGQPNFASALIIIANIINIILDYLFLAVFHMGIEGASLAMFIGYTVGLICVLKYHLDPERTYKFDCSNLKIKSWISSTIEIIKIGLPGASLGLFDVILVYVMNLILGAALGEIGLDIFNVCVNGLLIISILVIGVSETLSSIVPIYYAQNDFFNLNHLVRRTIIITMVCSLAFTLFLWIYPDGLLMLFNLNKGPDHALVQNALKIYALSFVPMAFSNILIFYYEGIERTVESEIVSVILTLIGPLLFTAILYPIIGVNSVWVSFPLGCILSIAIIDIYVKIIQRKESEYSGLFFVRKELLEKARNYALKNRKDDMKNEMLDYLESLNVKHSSLETLDNVINTIYDLDDEKIHIEILIIDYDDIITVNMKYEGKQELMKDIEKSFSQEKIKFSEVLGLNNIEYTIDKS